MSQVRMFNSGVELATNKNPLAATGSEEKPRRSSIITSASLCVLRQAGKERPRRNKVISSVQLHNARKELTSNSNHNRRNKSCLLEASGNNTLVKNEPMTNANMNSTF